MLEKDELDLLLDSALSTYADPGPHSGLEERMLAALSTERFAPESTRRIAGLRRRWAPWAVAIPVAASLLIWISIAKINHAPPAQNEQAHRSDRMQTAPINVPHAALRADVRPGLHPSGAEAHVHSPMFSARLKPPQRRRPVVGDPEKSCPVTELLPPGAANQGDCREADRRAAVIAAVGNAGSFPKLDVFPTPQPLTEQEQALLVYVRVTPKAGVEALAKAQAVEEELFAKAAEPGSPVQPPAEGRN